MQFRSLNGPPPLKHEQCGWLRECRIDTVDVYSIYYLIKYLVPFRHSLHSAGPWRRLFHIRPLLVTIFHIEYHIRRMARLAHTA